jgi:hypothetical protein
MFKLYCVSCDVSFPVEARSLVALHNTSDGPVGYLRCPTGHLDAVRLHEPRVAGADRVGRIAYLRGRPASEWMGAIAKGRRLQDKQLADLCA